MSSTFNGAIATMLGAQYAGTPTGTGQARPRVALVSRWKARMK